MLNAAGVYLKAPGADDEKVDLAGNATVVVNKKSQYILKAYDSLGRTEIKKIVVDCQLPTPPSPPPGAANPTTTTTTGAGGESTTGTNGTAPATTGTATSGNTNG